MSTVYATAADIEAQLRGLYPDGFENDTDPTETEVTDKIAEVTTSLRVRVVRALGIEPPDGSDAATLVKRGVVAKVVAWIIRTKMIGYSTSDVTAQAGPYEKDYSDVIAEIKMLPDMFRETTTEEPHVGRTSAFNVREPILSDDAIGRYDVF